MSQMMYNSGPMQYEMFNYGATPSNFYPTPQSDKIPVEYTGSSTLDDRDRRRRRSGSTSTSSKGEKENLTNMHLVCYPYERLGQQANYLRSDGEHRTELHRGPSVSGKRSMSKAWNTNLRICTRSTRTSFNLTAVKPTKCLDSTAKFLNSVQSSMPYDRVQINPSVRC